MQKMHIASSDKPVADFTLDVIINCRLLDEVGIAALTLLVAESAANQKETLIHLSMNMLAKETL